LSKGRAKELRRDRSASDGLPAVNGGWFVAGRSIM
jgi:hypothetical protein